MLDSELSRMIKKLPKKIPVQESSFWIVQVDFLDLIFHLKSLSEHIGKIHVLVKNQGTSYFVLGMR
jgi:hypothetical protein